MKSCGRARDVILLMLRQQATEAQRLFLDEHLAACAACREERASIGLLERLRDAPPSGLSSDARSRVLGQLLDTRPDVGRERTAERWRGPLWFALAAVPVVVIAIFVWRAMPAQPQAPQAQVAKPSPSLPQAPAVQRMSTTGETQLKGARFAYAANSAFRVHPDHRGVDLVAGELDVDVTPGGPGRFRVITPRFTVEVLGTRFVVSLGEARVLRGEVRVLSPDGEVIAVLYAGDSWRARESETASEPSRPLVDNPAPAIIRTEPSRNAPPPVVTVAHLETASRHAKVERPAPSIAPTDSTTKSDSLKPTVGTMPALSVTRKLAEARAALGHGQTKLAREIAAEVLSGASTPRERAMAELVNADAELVDRNPEGALSAYRRTALLFAAFPEGELAAFLSGQLLSERGRKADAREAFQTYLSRYASGRFARDVREKLDRLGGP